MLIKKLLAHAGFMRPVDDGDDSGGGEAVGTGNDARIAMLERINDMNDGLRADELQNVNDDGTTSEFQAQQVEDDVAQDDTAVEDNTPAAAEPQQQRYKIKVNGREIELSADELIARAQKVESADVYLNEASRLRREAEALMQPKQPVPPAQGVQADPEDWEAMVDAIQMGTKEEAVAALKRLKPASNAAPQLSPDDLARTVDERLTFKEAVGRFESEYADILKDNHLRNLALQRDQQLLQAGDRRGYWERFDSIGKELRGWRDQLVQAAQPDPLIAKATAKADAAKRSVPRPANVKASSAMNQDEPEQSASEVIAAIAKARGGPQWSRA